MKVVLDTNVVLSALVFGVGLPGRLRGAWQSRAAIPLVSTETVQELIRVLAYPKFRLSMSDQEELLADYLPYCQAVAIPGEMPPLPACRDPYDVMFLRLAIAGGASVLVSGDMDLLGLADAFQTMTGCAVMSLEEFFRRI